MPIYEYACSECFNKFEIRASLAEKGKGLKPECPNCHSKKTVQVFSSFAVMGGSKGRFNPGGIPGCGPTTGPGCC
jgi:putative FmdB family regulatory protein